MKKVMKFLACVSLSFVTLSSACSSLPFLGDEVNSKIEKIDYDSTVENVSVDLTSERFENPITDEQMPGRQNEQFEDGSLVGDPYYLRYNGKYYAYVSTESNEAIYRVWETVDLINYTFLGTFNLLDENGNADNKDLYCPWAPEVHYWNGDFYMYTSPNARGHKVLKSVNGTPWGDYQVVSNKFGYTQAVDGKTWIDGSVFIDDNEDKWFVVPTRTGITSGNPFVAVVPMEDMYTLSESGHKLLTNCGITGNWTEGPFMVKRDGVYYLINTGEQVGEPAYRINYAYNDSGLFAKDGIGDVDNKNEWETEYDPNLLLKTEGDYFGCGHGCLTIGPDLDSWWLPHHVSRKVNGKRTLELARVEFSGVRASVLGKTVSQRQTPNAPDFYYDGTASYNEMRTEAGEGMYWNTDGTRILSSKKTGAEFTAEYNFKEVAIDGTFKCLFGGGYVTITDKKIQLYKGTEKIGEGEMKETFNWNAYHRITVTYRDGRITVKVNDLTKIDLQVSGLGNDVIGYEGIGNAEVGATVFSNYAFGSSDNAEMKTVEGSFFATNYYKAKEGESASEISENAIKQVTASADQNDYNQFNGASALKLSEGDRAVYKIDVVESGLYAISSIFATENDGSIIKIQIDSNVPSCYQLMKNDYSCNLECIDEYTYDYSQFNYDELLYQRRKIDEIYLEKGAHTFTVKALQGEYTAIEYSIEKVSEYSPQYNDKLSVKGGHDYYSNWSIKDGAHYATSGVRNLVCFGTSGLTDYSLSVKVKAYQAIFERIGKTGVVVRMTNPTNMIRQDYGSGSGYFVYLDSSGVVVERFDYNHYIVAEKSMDLDPNTYHELEVSCEGNVLSVRLNGKKVITYVDPYSFVRGAMGLYSVDAEAYYKDLEVKPL